ncbi:MAG: glycosyltransferase [Rhodobacteraceae bacterium]|nr:glycosyltransferase [Paracoccaceae bacterium]
MNKIHNRLYPFDGQGQAPIAPPARPLGHILVNAGEIRQADLVRALELQLCQNAPLGDILVAEGMVDARAVSAAVAVQHGLYHADLQRDPPDAALIAAMPAEFWLRHRVVPWMRMDRTLVLATARPDRFAAVAADLPPEWDGVLPVVAAQGQILDALTRLLARDLAPRAEDRVPHRFSCRHWSPPTPFRKVVIFLLLASLSLCTFFWPMQSVASVALIAVLLLACITVLKLTGFVTLMLTRSRSPPAALLHTGPPLRMPRISVMVPMFHETEIAQHLVKRLHRLTYPKALLDVVLVLEEKDGQTRATLADTTLPPWMRVIEVPDTGGVTTKPRALNFAVDFCEGEIIGIWDAEDAPAPDQLERVAHAFAHHPPDVVCLQGALDYYNPRTNWIARCFTIEYASWWRMILPGMARLGMVIPLGGTTLFLRRDALDEMGGWDAHNVTEDADLGVRIARFGYRTAMVDTVTHEEANHRAWPWVKQRSRWLKGFMVTYLVHMSNPRELLADLGLFRFLGLQLFFVGTLSQFVFAPVLWSYWLIPMGVLHPVQTVASGGLMKATAALFFFSQMLNLGIGLVAVANREHKFLLPWVAALTFYFPMGALASYKALYELLIRPFYWDKTQHGITQPPDDITHPASG